MCVCVLAHLRLFALLMLWAQRCLSLCANAWLRLLSAHFIHPDTDTFYSGWDQHFLWHLTLSRANVTTPSHTQLNGSTGNTRPQRHPSWVTTFLPQPSPCSTDKSQTETVPALLCVLLSPFTTHGEASQTSSSSTNSVRSRYCHIISGRIVSGSLVSAFPPGVFW